MSDMHGRIMGLASPNDRNNDYDAGFVRGIDRAAEIASEGDALIAEMLAAMERIHAVYSVSHSPESRASAWADVSAAIAKARAFGVVSNNQDNT